MILFPKAKLEFLFYENFKSFYCHCFLQQRSVPPWHPERGCDVPSEPLSQVSVMALREVLTVLKRRCAIKKK